jgi:pimeloyl-ACP methyl ester carboxylesterase
MPVIERAGARLHYKVEGSGAPVLMVHSATSTGAHDWDALVRRLSPMYCCIVPDLRSHGISDHVDGALGLSDVVSDFRALITHIGRARPHIVGFSFGAEVALDMEIQQPGTAESLILVSPGTGHPEGLPRAEESVEAEKRTVAAATLQGRFRAVRWRYRGGTSSRRALPGHDLRTPRWTIRGMGLRS